MPRYDLLGLSVESSRAFPDFPQAESAAPPDLRLHWAPSLASLDQFYRERRPDPSAPATLTLTKSDHAYHFAYEDGTRFLLSGDGAQVSAVIAPHQSIEDTLTYFTGPIMGFILALRGIFCLHASAVLLDGAAVAFVGPAGAGKSTTAALLNQAGLPVISDDALPCLPCDGQLQVHSSYPRVRLWEDSVFKLKGTPDALPLLTPNWSKRYLPLDEAGFACGLFPLQLIVFLGADPPSLPTVLRLAHSTYIGDLLPPERAAQHFAHMAELARSVPVVNFDRPQNSQEYLALLRNTLNATRRVTMG